MNQALPKILLAAPQADVKAYCFDEWVESAKGLIYPNYKIFLCDNSATPDFSKKIVEKGISCRHLKANAKPVMRRIATSLEIIRNKVLDDGYEYLFMLETDVFPPPHIIDHLLTARKSVIGALYHIGLGNQSNLMVQVVKEDNSEFFKYTHPINGQAGDFIDGSIKKVFHVGLGCILIHRSVLKKIKFRYEPGLDMHPDSLFAFDCYNHGISIYADTSIICKHLNARHD